MPDAKNSWALVVAIDQYDAPDVRNLTGPVADAREAIGWLRKVGVPDEHILFHASPTPQSQSVCDAIGISYQDAREPTIWASVAQLRTKRGDGLYVFLFGHGLYDPETRRLFLTQEAGVGGAYPNLGLEQYRELFLSMSFRDQFVVMDGCLNYPYADNRRSTVQARMYGGVAGFTAQPGNALVECFAASQDQRAAEIDGRGAFARRLFEAIDPEDTPAEYVDFDFLTGERTIDLRKVMDRVIPWVENDAAGLSTAVQQRPQIFTHGRAGSERIPLCSLPAMDADPVTVDLQPEPAGSIAERLRVELIDYPDWTHVEPPFGNTVDFPVNLRLPAGVQAEAKCRLQPQATWADPETVAFTAQPNWSVMLTAVPGAATALGPAPPHTGRLEDLAPTGSPIEFELKLVERDGSPSYEMTGTHYAALADRAELDDTGTGTMRSTGVELFVNEDGPVVVVDGDHLAEGLASVNRIAEAMRTVAPKEANLRISGPPSMTASAIAFEVDGTPESLAGFLSGEPAISVHRPWSPEPVVSLSVLDVKSEPLLILEPGAAMVRLELPWGSWSTQVRVPTVGPVTVALPETVGTPPLRVGLAADLVETPPTPADVWVLTDDEPRLRDGLLDTTRRSMEAVAAGPTWIWRGPSASSGQATIVSVGSRSGYSFPLNTHGALAVSIDPRRPRVEPLSSEPAPEWDLLLAAGRLDALVPEQAVELTNLKWRDYIIGLAGGYAVYASGDPQYLDIVVGNLMDIGSTFDVTLLQYGSYRRRGEDPPGWMHDLLVGFATDGAVPLLRWGVQLALDVAALPTVEAAAPAWVAKIEEVAAGVIPTSVWTMWTETR